MKGLLWGLLAVSTDTAVLVSMATVCVALSVVCVTLLILLSRRSRRSKTVEKHTVIIRRHVKAEVGGRGAAGTLKSSSDSAQSGTDGGRAE